MALSRERANDLSHRVLEALRKTPGVELTAEAEFVRNRIASALQEWEKESDGPPITGRERMASSSQSSPRVSASQLTTPSLARISFQA